MKKYLCEFIGTAVLVLFGCGTAVITGGGVFTVAMAFGLSIIAMAYVIGNVSGCHLNPAVSLAMFINKKMDVKEFVKYVIAQCLGAIAGIGILALINACCSELNISNFGANAFGDETAIGINWFGAFIVEVILTFVFVYTILGVTSDEKKSSVAGIVIGLTLAFVHILGIPLTGTSVNPARSLGAALFSGAEAIAQLWVFILAPMAGSAVAAYAYKFLNKAK